PGERDEEQPRRPASPLCGLCRTGREPGRPLPGEAAAVEEDRAGRARRATCAGVGSRKRRTVVHIAPQILRTGETIANPPANPAAARAVISPIVVLGRPAR